MTLSWSHQVPIYAKGDDLDGNMSLGLGLGLVFPAMHGHPSSIIRLGGFLEGNHPFGSVGLPIPTVIEQPK